VAQPADWAPRNLAYQKYDLRSGEGARFWRVCQERAGSLVATPGLASPGERFGQPHLVTPRLGQGIFRVAVTDAYGRACAATGEHSPPALDPAHIRPYARDGQHAVSNGLLLRSDLHRLFDRATSP
jgi:putative restriction endonuclease